MARKSPDRPKKSIGSLLWGLGKAAGAFADIFSPPTVPPPTTPRRSAWLTPAGIGVIVAIIGVFIAAISYFRPPTIVVIPQGSNTHGEFAGEAEKETQAKRDKARDKTEIAQFKIARLKKERDEAEAETARLKAERDKAKVDAEAARLKAERDQAEAKAETARLKAKRDKAKADAEAARLKAERDKAEEEAARVNADKDKGKTDPARLKEAKEWFLRGEGLFNIATKNFKDPELAIPYFTKAIEIDPNYFDAYKSLGIAYGHLRNFQGMIQNLDKAILLNPKDKEVFYARGIAHEAKKDRDLESACGDLGKACDLGMNEACRIVKRNCLNAEAEAETARETVEQDKTEMESARQDAVREWVKKGDDLWNRATGKSTDPKLAISYYTKAILLDHNYTFAYISRALVHLSIRDLDSACQDWRKACDLDFEKACGWINDTEECGAMRGSQ